MEQTNEKAPAGAQKHRRGWQFYAKLAVSLALLAVLFYKCDFASLAANLRQISIPILLLVMVIHFLSNVLCAFRWKLLYPHASVFTLWTIVMTSGFYSTVLPGQLFGEASKIVSLSQHSQSDRARVETVASSVVVDKITSLIALLLLGIAGAVCGSCVYQARIAAVLAAVLVVFVFALYIVRFDWCITLIRRILSALSKRFQKAKKVLRKLDGFFESWREATKNPRVLLLVVAAGILYHSMLALVLYLTGQALGVTVLFWDWCWIHAIMTVALLLPITIGGIGLRESTVVGLLGLFGVPTERSLLVSFVSFFLQLLAAALGGIIVLTKSIRARGGTQQPPETGGKSEVSQ